MSGLSLSHHHVDVHVLARRAQEIWREAGFERFVKRPVSPTGAGRPGRPLAVFAASATALGLTVCMQTPSKHPD